MSAHSKTLTSAMRFAEVMYEPDKARGSLEQILPRGGEGQAHVTFAELAECAAWRDGHVLTLDKGPGEIHRWHTRLGHIGPHVESSRGTGGGKLAAIEDLEQFVATLLVGIAHLAHDLLGAGYGGQGGQLGRGVDARDDRLLHPSEEFGKIGRG